MSLCVLSHNGRILLCPQVQNLYCLPAFNSSFVSGFYKIKPRKKTGLCMHHQKKIATAIKRARQMGILPYTPK
ncbi:MAG: 30S ribosomal protein S18 [Bacteroidetes bacterium]|nr:30S ribosomal protein S18 [Bacteroidota bacterium]